MTKPIDNEACEAAFDTLKAMFPDHFVALIIADDVNGTTLTNMGDKRLEAVMLGILQNRKIEYVRKA